MRLPDVLHTLGKVMYLIPMVLGLLIHPHVGSTQYDSGLGLHTEPPWCRLM